VNGSQSALGVKIAPPIFHADPGREPKVDATRPQSDTRRWW